MVNDRTRALSGRYLRAPLTAVAAADDEWPAHGSSDITSKCLVSCNEMLIS